MNKLNLKSVQSDNKIITISKNQELNIDDDGNLELNILDKENNTFHGIFDDFNFYENRIIINNKKIKASLIFIEISKTGNLNGTLQLIGPIADLIIYSRNIKCDGLILKDFKNVTLATKKPVFNLENIKFESKTEPSENISVGKNGIYFKSNEIESCISLISRTISSFGDIYSKNINFDVENNILIGDEGVVRPTIHAENINFLSHELKNYGFIKSYNDLKIKSEKIENFHEIISEVSMSFLVNELNVYKKCRIESHTGNISIKEKEKDYGIITNHGTIISGADIVINSTKFNNIIYDRNSFDRENIATIYSDGDLKIETTYGRNYGGVIFSKKIINIYSQENKNTSGVFNNLSLFEYQDLITNNVKKKKLIQCGGVIFALNKLDIRIKLFTNTGPVYPDDFDFLNPEVSSEIYATYIKMDVTNFYNYGGVINGKSISINAINDIKNISGCIIGVENKLNAKNIINETHTNIDNIELDYSKHLQGKIALIKSKKDTFINAKETIFIFGSVIRSDKNLFLKSENNIIISSNIIIKYNSYKNVENDVKDSFFKVLTSNNTINNDTLCKNPIISILIAKFDIELKAENLININGSKIQSDNNIKIESLSKNIDFSPFYLCTAIKNKENLSRNIRILLFGIKTWEENIDSLNCHVELNHLTTELLFSKDLIISASNGIVNIGEVDFACTNDNAKSSISILAGEITSSYDKICKSEKSTVNYEFFGIRTEVHSSFSDALSDAVHKLNIQGDEKTQIKGVILKSAQFIGDASNVYLGDSLGGAISLVNEVSKTNTERNQSSDGFSLLYADNILIKSTKSNIDLRGIDIFSENGKIEISSEGALYLRESSDEYTWLIDSKGEKFSLETFVNTNAFAKSAGIGVRGTYDHSAKESSLSEVHFIAFNISAKAVSIASKKETFLCGGKITSGSLTCAIGGNLKIQTVQDSEYEKTQEKSWGGSLGVDVNTITKFGINFDVHGNIGDYGVSAALVTQQTGIFSNYIQGSINGNIELIGSYIINESDSSNLIINGDIYASTLEDFKNKNGFIFGGGIGFSGDGRPIGNINYSSPEEIEYKASNLPTMSGMKIKNKVIGNLNQNKNELMKISRFNSVGQIDIKGTFSLRNKKQKNIKNKKNNHIDSLKENISKLTEHQILTYKINKNIENFEKKDTPFKFKDRSYISIDKNLFEVKWDNINNTWRIISPLYSFSKPTIPVHYLNGEWMPHSNVGLRGGTNTDSSKIDHVDYSSSRRNSLVEKISGLMNNASISEENHRITTADGSISSGDNSNFFMDLNTAHERGYISDQSTVKVVDRTVFSLLKMGSEINDFVRNTFPLGAGNQKSDIISSNAISMLRLNAYREIYSSLLPRDPSQPYRDKVRLMQAAFSGNCGEYSEMAYQYAFHRFRDDIQINKVNNPTGDHAFLVIEPRSNANPDYKVVIDPWTVQGGVHLLNDNKFGVGTILKTNESQSQPIPLNKKTKSQADFSKLYESFFKECIRDAMEAEQKDKIEDFTTDILIRINQSTPEGDAHDHDLWNIENSIRDTKIVYKLLGESAVFLPSLPHLHKKPKTDAAVNSIMLSM